MRFTIKALILAVIFCVQTITAHAQSKAPDSTMTVAERNAAANLLQATNQDRSAHGLPILHPDPMLTKAAWEHAQRMVASGTLSHQLAGEPNLIFRVQNVGLQCSTVAENVAEAPTVEQINDEWMHSPSHRANLLEPKVNIVGIAIIKKHGELYAVEDFARALTALTLSQQVDQVVTLLASHGLNARGDQALGGSYCDTNHTQTSPQPKLIVKYSTVDLNRLPGRVQVGIADGTYRKAVVGACNPAHQNGFTAYQMVILLY